MHGSHTSVGQKFDSNFIDIVAFTAHQASISGLNSSNPSVLHDLSVTSRTQSGIQTQSDIMEMSISKDVSEWAEVF